VSAVIQYVGEELRSPVYIAGPFFNPAQVAVIEEIEGILTERKYEHFSPRRDSGSADMTPEERKVMSNWKPVFESNCIQIGISSLVLAVIEYVLPPDVLSGVLTPIEPEESYTTPDPNIFECHGHRQIRESRRFMWPHRFRPLAIPDTGTVWEMGFAQASMTPVVGYLPTARPEAMNLMLAQGVVGVISGPEQLQDFLTPGVHPQTSPEDLMELMEAAEDMMSVEVLKRSHPDFAWDALSKFEGKII
jgi:nucleoside 2-deoxyribosyltransferase